MPTKLTESYRSAQGPAQTKIENICSKGGLLQKVRILVILPSHEAERPIKFASQGKSEIYLLPVQTLCSEEGMCDYNTDSKANSSVPFSISTTNRSTWYTPAHGIPIRVLSRPWETRFAWIITCHPSFQKRQYLLVQLCEHYYFLSSARPKVDGRRFLLKRARHRSGPMRAEKCTRSAQSAHPRKCCGAKKKRKHPCISFHAVHASGQSVYSMEAAQRTIKRKISFVSTLRSERDGEHDVPLAECLCTDSRFKPKTISRVVMGWIATVDHTDWFLACSG